VRELFHKYATGAESRITHRFILIREALKHARQRLDEMRLKQFAE
jgi:hypothetical protein